MIDRLEKFSAPPRLGQLIVGAPILAMVIWACHLDAPVDVPTSSAAPAAAERTLPLSHPLGCPEEDEAGRKLKGTLSIKGERRPRCYYGK